MHISTAARVAATLTACVALVATATTTASAAIPHRTPFAGFTVGRAGSLVAVPATDIQSTEAAGYVQPFTETGTGTYFRADVTVSRINCAAKPANPLYTIISVYGQDSSGGFQGAGTLLSASCDGKTPNYTAQAFVNDSNFSLVQYVSPGDTIIARTTVASDSVTATFNDANNGTSAGEDGTGYTVNGAQANLQGGYGSGDYPRFYKPVVFSGVKLDSAAFNAATVNHEDEVDSGGNVIISAGPLNSKGYSFTDTWMGNQTNG